MKLLFFNSQEIIVKDCFVKTGTIQSLFSTGDYKIIYFFDKKEEPIIVINVIGSMFSPVKDSFGKRSTKLACCKIILQILKLLS